MDKKDKTLHMRLGPELQDKLQKMCDWYGLNASNLIRKIIGEYFEKQYRVGRYGQQKGSDTNKNKKDFNPEVDRIISNLQTADDDEANEIINSCGFAAYMVASTIPSDMHPETALFKIGSISGSRGLIFSNEKTGDQPILFLNWNELLQKLEEFLTNKSNG